MKIQSAGTRPLGCWIFVCGRLKRATPAVRPGHSSLPNLALAGGCWVTQRFDFETSPRISRNSLGPLRSRRFRILRSSSDVDGSLSLSSSCAAKSSALDAASRFRRRNGCDAANPSSRSRRIASEREVTPFASPTCRLQQLTWAPIEWLKMVLVLRGHDVFCLLLAWRGVFS